MWRLLLFAQMLVSGYSQIPPNLVVTMSDHCPVLAWKASPTVGVTGYEVFRSIKTGGPYTKLTTLKDVNSSPYTDISAAKVRGVTYYYVVRAKKGSLESVNSNEAVAVIP